MSRSWSRTILGSPLSDLYTDLDVVTSWNKDGRTIQRAVKPVRPVVVRMGSAILHNLQGDL